MKEGVLGARQHNTATYSLGNQLSGTAGNGALLDNNGTLTSVLGDNSGNSLKGSHVGGTASADTTLLCGCVDGNEDNVGLGNAARNIGGEEEVALARRHADLAVVRGECFSGGRSVIGEEGLAATIAGDADNVMQAGLVDGGVSRVPAADPGLVTIYDGDLDVRVLKGEDSSSWATWLLV